MRGVPQKQKVDDIHCNDMDCSDIRCSDTHCRDIFGSDSSDIHGSDFQRSVTRKYRLPIFLCLCHVFRSISWPQKAEGQCYAKQYRQPEGQSVPLAARAEEVTRRSLGFWSILAFHFFTFFLCPRFVHT